MAFLKVGIQSFSVGNGRNNQVGQKRVFVHSDTALHDDDYMQVLDATDPDSGYFVPKAGEVWDASSTQFTVVNRTVDPFDDGEDGAQQYHFFLVTVDYETPEGSIGQENDDPTKRDWEWSVTSQNEQRALTHSKFTVDSDISAYYPGLEMVLLPVTKAFTNTAGEPPDSGVMGNHKKRSITLSKYYSSFSDIGSISDAEELEGYIDTLNSGDTSVLDILRSKWTLYMDDIKYEGVVINDDNYLHVVYELVYDPLTHIFVYPSAGFNQIDGTALGPILTDDGGEIGSPQLLDSTGVLIPRPGSAPYLKTPVLVAGGTEDQSDWSALGLPSAIPGI